MQLGILFPSCTNYYNDLDNVNSNLVYYTKWQDVNNTTDSNGNLEIGHVNTGVIPLSCVPITAGVMVSGIFLNDYGCYYAKTSVNNVSIRVRILYSEKQY